MWSLVQIMGCSLFRTLPLPEPILTYCQLECQEYNSVEWNLNQNTEIFIEMHLKMSFAKYHYVQAWVCKEMPTASISHFTPTTEDENWFYFLIWCITNIFKSYIRILHYSLNNTCIIKHRHGVSSQVKSILFPQLHKHRTYTWGTETLLGLFVPLFDTYMIRLLDNLYAGVTLINKNK